MTPKSTGKGKSLIVNNYYGFSLHLCEGRSILLQPILITCYNKKALGEFEPPLRTIFIMQCYNCNIEITLITKTVHVLVQTQIGNDQTKDLDHSSLTVSCHRAHPSRKVPRKFVHKRFLSNHVQRKLTQQNTHYGGGMVWYSRV